MEVEKRKRQDDGGEIDGKRKRVSEDNGRVTAEDDEVEEFFAILRRMHTAVQYFEKGNCERELTAKGETSLSPSFEKEDFEKTNGVKDPNGVVEEEEEKEEAGLDLNTNPEEAE